MPGVNSNGNSHSWQQLPHRQRIFTTRIKHKDCSFLLSVLIASYKNTRDSDHGTPTWLTNKSAASMDQEAGLQQETPFPNEKRAEQARVHTCAPNTAARDTGGSQVQG